MIQLEHLQKMKNGLLDNCMKFLKFYLVKFNSFSLSTRYTTLCSQILEQNADNFQAFSCDFLPHLLSLRNDKVPNIRLSLARVLSNYMGN
jgi:serine/threonine-protein phosphatase 4 regulatory subunit 1